MIERIKRILFWIPILWKDKDYDWTYVFLILGSKLKRFEKSLSEDQYFGSDRDLQALRRASTLCFSIWRDKYLQEEPDGDIKKADEKRKQDIKELYHIFESRLINIWS